MWNKEILRRKPADQNNRNCPYILDVFKELGIMKNITGDDQLLMLRWNAVEGKSRSLSRP